VSAALREVGLPSVDFSAENDRWLAMILLNQLKIRSTCFIRRNHSSATVVAWLCKEPLAATAGSDGALRDRKFTICRCLRCMGIF
jgi:hypothetical protein